MPLYEYECKDCAGIYELLRRLSARDALMRCPGCGSLSMRRRFVVPFSHGNNRSNRPHPALSEPSPGPSRAGSGSAMETFFYNCRITNCHTAIAAENANIRLRGSGLHMSGNQIGIDAENSNVDVDIGGLVIE